MAREFPRFLYSDPQNTKSKGPFVLHTLEPKFLCKIIPPNGMLQNTAAIILEIYSGTEQEAREVLPTIIHKYVNKHFQ